MKPVKAWWFSKGFELPHGDGRKIALGETHKIEGEIMPCVNGLHACRKIIDALDYAPGSIIWRVELKGKIIKRHDKLCASERKYLSGGIDASAVLGKFARLCALDVVHLWDCPEVVLEYLKTGDETLRHDAESSFLRVTGYSPASASWSAARSAAEAIAGPCARHAARSAAEAIAESSSPLANRYPPIFSARFAAAAAAAWSSAESAAWSSAESAATAASGYAAQRVVVERNQNKRLTTMINNFIEEKGKL